MENPLELPPPDDPVERIKALARDLAYGALHEMWYTEITILKTFRGEVWATSSPRSPKIGNYLRSKWGDDHPSAELLASHGFLILVSDSKYSISQKAFSLIEQHQASDSESSTENTPKVFVVHGRNLEARDALFEFLESIGLEPISWEQAKRETGKATPYIHDILDTGFAMAQAAVVLLTPDDEARLQRNYLKEDDDEYEKNLTGQPRQNVLYEAGIAKAHFQDRTVFVELGKRRPFSDLDGLHPVRLDNSESKRRELADSLRNALKNAKCAVDLTETKWKTTGNFEIDQQESPTKPIADSRTCWTYAYYSVWLILDLQFAALKASDLNAIDSFEMTREKLSNAYNHAAALDLVESNAGQILQTLKRRVESTFGNEWTVQQRQYVVEHIDYCRSGFLKLLESYHTQGSIERK